LKIYTPRGYELDAERQLEQQATDRYEQEQSKASLKKHKK